jgi:hypothetical protein
MTSATTSPPERQIRASYTPSTVTVYQAFNEPIAAAAVAVGTLAVPGFKRTRSTWLKPTLLYMIWRADWGRKGADQAHILAIDLRREAFEGALRLGKLNEEGERAGDVTVRWHQERDIYGQPLGWKTVSLGLRGEAVHKYVDEWIVGIRDITEECARIKRMVDEGDEEGAYAALPREEAYELDRGVSERLGATYVV